MSNEKISEYQRNILRAVASCDPRPTGQIAEAAGISRPFLINAINGERGVSSESIEKILKAVHLTTSWTLDPAYAHVWSVGADVGPLVIAVNALVPLPAVWSLTKTFGDNAAGPYRGFFLICSRDPSFKHGHPAAPYIIVDRDKFRLGRGNKSAVSPDDAQAITPALFEKAEWGVNNNSQIYFQEKLHQIESIVKNGVTLNDVLKMIGYAPTTWESVIRVASEAGVSPQDVLELLVQRRIQKLNAEPH